MDEQKSISFLIVNYNGKEHLKECFNTLNKLNYPKEKIEIIMVDNGSEDNSVEFVRNKYKNIKIIQNSMNEGFAKPNNDAAKIATGDYLAMINNDMKLDSNWINDMLESLNNCDDDYVCVGSKILNWDGSKLDFAGGSINFYGHGYQEDFGIDIDEADKKHNKDKDMLFACGGSMIIDRKVFLEVGGFDEDYFAYFEDVDLGWRLWTLGYKVRYCSKSICYHKHNGTSKKMNRNRVMRMYNRNSLFTIYKNYESEKVYKMLTAALLLKNCTGVSHKNTEEQSPEQLAIMDFANKLSVMNKKREYIQSHRKISDKEIINLFIESPYRNLISMDSNKYNEMLSNMLSSMNFKEYFGNQKYSMLIICTDNIATKMAGPGIRYFEIAKQLSNICDVTLAIPNKTDIDDSNLNFKFLRYNTDKPQNLINKFHESDIVLIHGMILEKITVMKNICKEKIMIVDLYDPYTIENLEIHKNKSLQVKMEIHENDLNTLNNQLNLGDYFICANEKQKDYWIGMLSALNKVNPAEYEISNKLEKLIGTVPFGISETDPIHKREALKEKVPNLKSNDKVLIWGGGVWNWFDPLSLIKAIYNISKERDDIKLLFLGVKHPNPEIPEMEMTTKAIMLAEELGIKDKFVFFNMDWVEYEDRQNFLLESYAGVSCHFDNLETRYSFRTRILDYLWAELPIIATEGDYFAEDIVKNNLGLVVKYNDESSISKAILKLVDDKEFYKSTKMNIKKYREQFKWNVVVKELKDFCNNPVKKKNSDSAGSNDIHNFIMDINQTSKEEIAGPILNDYKIGQKFRCRYPNLTSISLIFGTYSRVNEHNLKFKLFDGATDTLLVEKDIDASVLVDNSWFEISFKPIINSEGRTLYFYLEAEGASPRNCVALFKDENIDNCGQIWNDELVYDGSLTMKTKCILSENHISKEIGIEIPENSFGIANNRLANGNMSNINTVQMTNKDIDDIKMSVAKLSKNVSELNKWKSKLSGRLNIFRNMKIFRK
jgi:GT2 family glycosyltransferase/glycosyltransferase involved in cell wall biosynthesis